MPRNESSDLSNTNSNEQHLLVDDINGDKLPIYPINTDEIIASCENIHKTYLLGVEGVPALRGVTADVYRRDFLVVYGTSGGGKSTLLNVFGTIDVPTKGNLQLFSRRITERTPDSFLALLRCRKVGFVFQSFNLLSTMSAMDNVKLPMIIAGDLDGAAIEKRAEELLVSVGLGHRLQHFPSQLSGGEQQRVTIARALANEPDVLLLDEPTGDLDTRNTHFIMNILLDLNIKKGLTMVMVTHDVYMKKYATRILHLRDGRLAREERVDHNIRVDGIQELKKSVTKQREELEKLKAGASLPETATKFTQESRAPTHYSTFTKKASNKTFYTHEHPILFQELFGKNRAKNPDTKAVSMSENNNTNNHQEADNASTAFNSVIVRPAGENDDDRDTSMTRTHHDEPKNNNMKTTQKDPHARSVNGNVVNLPRRGRDNEDDETYGSEMKTK